MLVNIKFKQILLLIISKCKSSLYNQQTIFWWLISHQNVNKFPEKCKLEEFYSIYNILIAFGIGSNFKTYVWWTVVKNSRLTVKL